ncbi:MAG TPA: hypothetical protein DDW38_00980 [Psychrobacter sp.]|nr:hypothetical protein [Psychrobacter sp.]
MSFLAFLSFLSSFTFLSLSLSSSFTFFSIFFSAFLMSFFRSFFISFSLELLAMSDSFILFYNYKFYGTHFMIKRCDKLQ